MSYVSVSSLRQKMHNIAGFLSCVFYVNVVYFFMQI